MHQQTLTRIVAELDETLSGRFAGKIFQLSAFSLAIDFGLKPNRYLFISAEPDKPRIYLIERKLRELEKQSMPLSPSVQAMRASLGGGNLLAVRKDESDRIVRLSFSIGDEIGEVQESVLVAQLTGRAANLFLLDEHGRITHSLRPLKGHGQQVGERYEPPKQRQRISDDEAIRQGEFASISTAVDDHYRRLESDETFAKRADNLRRSLQKEIARKEKLISNLHKDLAAHGDPEQHKRLGDLLFANISNAERDGNVVRLKDYYAEGAPVIEIQVEPNDSLQKAAARLFSRYGKAKRAIEEISARLLRLDRELGNLRSRQAKLEDIVASKDAGALASFDDGKTPRPRQKKEKTSSAIPGVRRYRSSDGYEVLVGKAARDNDRLAFRVARPNDLWLHAADYPGSHVIVRQLGRKEIPHRTIIEAAQLAAKFSQANNDSKVTIHYTQRKFLSKPKGAAPGLVRMSNFRTMTVEPRESIERI